MSPSRAEDELSAPETREGRRSQSNSWSFSFGHAAKFSGNEHVGASEGRRDQPPARGSSHMTSTHLYPAQRVSEEFKNTTCLQDSKTKTSDRGKANSQGHNVQKQGICLGAGLQPMGSNAPPSSAPRPGWRPQRHPHGLRCTGGNFSRTCREISF